MDGYFVGVKEKGRIVFALDCIRVPGALSHMPEPINWRPHIHPGEFRAEHRAIVRTLDSFETRHFELTARRHR
jgi:hypothetical protein